MDLVGLSLSYLGYKRSFMDFFEKWTTFIVVYYSQTIFFCTGALFSWTILSYLVPMSGQKVAVFLGFVCILYSKRSVMSLCPKLFESLTYFLIQIKIRRMKLLIIIKWISLFTNRTLYISIKLYQIQVLCICEPKYIK